MASSLDEREQMARSKASWLGFISFVGLYILGSGVFIATGNQIDIFTKLTFAISFILFIAVGIRTEAFNFRLPLLKEDEHSLEAPAVVRSVPWMILLLGGISFAFNGVLASIAIAVQGSNGLTSYQDWLVISPLLRSLIPLIGSIGLFIYYYLLANLVRRGSKFGIATLQIYAPSVLFSYVIELLASTSFDRMTPSFTAGFEYVFIASLAYISWVSIFRQSELEKWALKKESKQGSEGVAILLLLLMSVILTYFVMFSLPFYAANYPVMFFWLAIPVSIIWLVVWALRSHKKLAPKFKWISGSILVAAAAGVVGIVWVILASNPVLRCMLAKDSRVPFQLYRDPMDPVTTYISCEDRLTFGVWWDSTVEVIESNEVREYRVGESTDSMILPSGESVEFTDTDFRILSSINAIEIPEGYLVDHSVTKDSFITNKFRDHGMVIYSRKASRDENGLEYRISFPANTKKGWSNLQIVLDGPYGIPNQELTTVLSGFSRF